jgi:hypothetical protein
MAAVISEMSEEECCKIESVSCDSKAGSTYYLKTSSAAELFHLGMINHGDGYNYISTDDPEIRFETWW